MRSDLAIIAAALAAVAVVCALVPAAVRRALLEGAHCLGRHPVLWQIPAAFTAAYATFAFLAEAFFHARMQDFTAWLLFFDMSPAPSATPLVLENILPAADRTASVFTIFTATFPLSAWFAILLLVNRHGLLREMIVSLRRRLGTAAGIALSALVGISALCAAAKPFVYLLHPEIVEHVTFAAELGIDLLSTLFELLLGIFFLTYLMLTTYGWRRGFHFERAKLLHVAMRRSGFVLKWSLLLAGLALGLIQLPLQAGSLFAPGSLFDQVCAWFSGTIGRIAVIGAALVFCPVQAILVFHNESLRHALRESRRLLRTEWPRIAPFLSLGFSLFLLLSGAESFLVSQLGAGTSAALFTQLLFTGPEALITGWLIASWVCLYKSLSAVRKEIPF